MKYLKTLLIPFILITLYSFNKETHKHIPTDAFFFFEMQPVKVDLPYYFSQTIELSYNDQPDLDRQRRNYFHELKIAIAMDGQDTASYKGYMPPVPGFDSQTACEAVRMSAEKALNDNSKNIINKQLQ
jgi:hypothetical protein